MKVYSAQDVCKMIDEFPNVRREVADVMKAEILKGECPHAVKASLKIRPVTMYVIDGEAAAQRQKEHQQ